jgi:hypothetical protein
MIELIKARWAKKNKPEMLFTGHVEIDVAYLLQRDTDQQAEIDRLRREVAVMKCCGNCVHQGKIGKTCVNYEAWALRRGEAIDD